MRAHMRAHAWTRIRASRVLPASALHVHAMPDVSRRGSSLIVVVALAIVGRPVGAQPASGQAEALFREGRALLAAGKVAEACAAFDASDHIDHVASTLLNRAECHQRLGQLATAWALFVDARRETSDTTDPKTQSFHRSASEHADLLEHRLSSLAIVVPLENRVAGLEVVRGTEVVDVVVWNHALPIDGGTYTISARVPGHETWTTTVVIQPEADHAVVTIPRLRENAGSAAVGVTTSPVTAASTEAGATPTSVPSRLPSYVLGGSALALGFGAAMFYARGSSANADANHAPDNAARDASWRTANRDRYVADAMLGVGVGCAVAAAWWLIHAGRADARRIAVVPAAGATHVSVVVEGAF